MLDLADNNISINADILANQFSTRKRFNNLRFRKNNVGDDGMQIFSKTHEENETALDMVLQNSIGKNESELEVFDIKISTHQIL